MKDELFQEILYTFPDLFYERDAFSKVYPLMFGIETLDGWFNLIYNLCQDVHNMSKQSGEDPVKLVQIKEKFGGLRFYYNGGNKAIGDRVFKAEEDSFHICEVCGDDGKLMSDGWLKTRCDKCN